jgi:hypothetical protein
MFKILFNASATSSLIIFATSLLINYYEDVEEKSRKSKESSEKLL